MKINFTHWLKFSRIETLIENHWVSPTVLKTVTLCKITKYLCFIVLTHKALFFLSSLDKSKSSGISPFFIYCILIACVSSTVNHAIVRILQQERLGSLRVWTEMRQETTTCYDVAVYNQEFYLKVNKVTEFYNFTIILCSFT